MAEALRILHIENDAVEAELFQELLRQELGSKRFEFVPCTSLQDGLAKFKDGGFDAVLLDLELDDISGMDNVRAVIEENRDCPVIVLSGHDNKEMALEAIKLGAQEYVIKGYGNGRVLRLGITILH
ncbi:MAG: response regulator [Rickettsiales bacterium]|nr:response regulator [Rickettsiales bacterium]